jgi:hypothetical protein
VCLLVRTLTASGVLHIQILRIIGARFVYTHIKRIVYTLSTTAGVYYISRYNINVILLNNKHTKDITIYLQFTTSIRAALIRCNIYYTHMTHT